MNASMILQASYDFWRGRGYALKEYLIKDGKRHPFALICPGGGYGMVCSFLEGKPYAKRLNELGYSAFVLYYRCGSKAKYPAPQDDLARALTSILNRGNELGVETDGYSVWGSSAGGHLAATFGTEELGCAHYGLPKPAALVLSYPVVTMKEHTHAGSRHNLLGKTPTKEEIACYSVEDHITKVYPPTFLWCGDADKTVDPKNSRELAAALERNGVPSEFIEYPSVDHGVGLGEGLPCEAWFQNAVCFWEKQRKREK